MGASGSPPDPPDSGVRTDIRVTGRYRSSGTKTRGGVPIEDCAFCCAGHLTAPGRAKREHHAQQRIMGGFLLGHLTCTGATNGEICGLDLEWVEDYGDEVVSAWLLGGAEAAYEIIRTAWRDSQPLEPR